MSGKTLVIPRALLFDRQFSPRAIKLWLFLQAWADGRDDEGNLTIIKDRASLAKALGYSCVATTCFIHDLENAGWMKVNRIPGSHDRKMTLYESPQLPPPTTKQGENQAPAEIQGDRYDRNRSQKTQTDR